MARDYDLKSSTTYEIKFAIGSREGYHGPSFTKEDVLSAIGEFQKTHPLAMPVKVTDHVTFIMKDYREDGWDISGICYPNSSNRPDQVQEFMFDLAEHLLYRFKQNRITIRTLCEAEDYAGHRPPHTVMFEIKDAEKTHTK
jgi:hypothetical protein